MNREFYTQDAQLVAKKLLGKILVHKTPEGITKGMIVETEAYYGKLDPGSHAYRGKRTPRNEVMWGPPGYAYVYFTYGMHYMLNVVTGKDSEASAVLIRAAEPLYGIELMKKRRRMLDLKNLINGPAKLTQAFKITREENGIDMINSNLRIEDGKLQKFSMVSTTRIGIKKGASLKLRFYVKGNKFISKR
ncbi:DNA-3-methyladenine glycosylase [candidate division WOR-3 bacterium]|nr:DNA-3-methyladenine glycosylase [candidate division WOR-3 bacterium]